MFFEKVEFNKLESRLDAGFYEPRYLELSERLKTLGAVPLKTIVSKIACGPFGGNAIADDLYQDDGLLFIRPVNISSNVFDDSSIVKVPEEVLVENGLKVYDGDNLYFGRVGVPCVALISGRTSISPNIIIAQTKGSLAEPYYLSCFSSSRYGLSQLKRQLKEVAQPTTSTDAVKDLLVYVPHIDAQTYIGNKVHQAELLRSRGESIKNKLGELEAKIPLEKPIMSRLKHSVATTVNLSENRLDAKFYAEQYLDLYSQFSGEFKKLSQITSGFKYGASVKADYVKSGGIPFIRGNAISDGSINSNDLVYINNGLKDELANCYVKKGDVLITRSGTVGNVSDVEEELDNSAYGSFVIKCSPIRSEILPEYLSWYLNSWVGNKQFRRLENGAVQQNVNIEELSSIFVWIADSDFQNNIATLIFAKRITNVLSNALTKSAKLLVESLIEGQISEPQLIAAQRALEEGDNSKDRAILNKLTDKGYLAEGGKPLFDDLDKLYELLDEAKNAIDGDSSESAVGLV